MSSWGKHSTMSSLSATTRTNDVRFFLARPSASIGALKTRQQHTAMRQNALTCFVVCGTRYANDFVSSPVTHQLRPEDRFQAMVIAQSVFLFILAALCEIGGGYLVWLCIREGKSIWLALAGALVLVLYGVVPTLQPANFGRVYAAYGGIFVVISLLWGWRGDRISPDRFELLGGAIVLRGAGVM